MIGHGHPLRQVVGLTRPRLPRLTEPFPAPISERTDRGYTATVALGYGGQVGVHEVHDVTALDALRFIRHGHLTARRYGFEVRCTLIRKASK